MFPESTRARSEPAPTLLSRGDSVWRVEKNLRSDLHIPCGERATHYNNRTTQGESHEQIDPQNRDDGRSLGGESTSFLGTGDHYSSDFSRPVRSSAGEHGRR